MRQTERQIDLLIRVDRDSETYTVSRGYISMNVSKDNKV